MHSKAIHGLLLAAVLAVVLSGCRSPKGPRFDPYLTSDQALGEFQSIQGTNTVEPDQLKPPADFYQLGPGDVVEIEIVGEANSTATVNVGPDGKIYYSLLPGTFVWGLTLAEAKKAIEAGFRPYQRVEPEINLVLRGVSSRRIWVLGNVEAPGILTLATPMTVLEAVSAAGGVSANPGYSQDAADLANSFVMREGQRLPVDLDALFRKGDLTQNIYVQPGDYLYIRPSVARNVYVLGAVQLPNIVPYKERLSVVGAVATVGGPIKYAQLSQVAIIRGSLANPTIAVVDFGDIIKGKRPNVPLQPGDIVYVPFTPYKKLFEFAELILDEFVRTVALNEGIGAVDENAEPVTVSVGSGQAVAP